MRIAKKSIYRKPDMVKDQSDSDDDIKSEDIHSAMKKAEISRFRQNLEKRQKEVEEFERHKLMRKSMSVLECRRQPDVNRQVISFNLEMQILEVLRIIKGKGKQREDKETQTDAYKFLPNNVHEEIDYDNLNEKKELYAIRQIVLPPRKKSNDSEAEDEGLKKKKKKKKKLKKVAKKKTSLTFKVSDTKAVSFRGDEMLKEELDMIKDDEEYYEYEEEEEESESEFEKSEGDPPIEDIQIRSTDDKDTKQRKLREAYFRLAKQETFVKDYDTIDLNPQNEGPSPNNPLIEVMDVELNLNEKATPMPEGTLFKIIENTLDERLFKEMEGIINNDSTQRETDLNKFFYDQLLMHYGLKKLAIKNIQSLCQGNIEF
jgi:hypothetical protein